MSAFKGTPGPWEIGEALCSHAPAVIGDGDSVVCEFSGRVGASVCTDARLIAAAPELLSCLEMTAHGLEVASRVVGGELGAVFSDRAMSARDAIAKATGGAA